MIGNLQEDSGNHRGYIRSCGSITHIINVMV